MGNPLLMGKHSASSEAPLASSICVFRLLSVVGLYYETFIASYAEVAGRRAKAVRGFFCFVR